MRRRKTIMWVILGPLIGRYSVVYINAGVWPTRKAAIASFLDWEEEGTPKYRKEWRRLYREGFRVIKGPFIWG